MGDRELQSQNEKEDEERQHRETMTQVDQKSKEQRRLQKERGENFLSNLEKVVTPEGLEYYVDRSSAKDGGDECLFMRFGP